MIPPCISIIIPSYNCLTFLPQAIQCINQQNINNYEVLVADDASTDGTWDWLQQQKQLDSRIKPIQLKGVGPSVARNICIQKSQSELIAFLDADDIWYDNKLEAQINFMNNYPQVVLSFTDFRHVNSNGEDLGGCFQFWPLFNTISKKTKGYRLLPNPLSSIYQENIIGTSTVVTRKSAIIQVGGFDKTLPSAEDWDLWLKLSQQGAIAFSNQIEMDYLMRPHSESSKITKRLQAMKIIMQRYEATASLQNKAIPRRSKARYLTAQAELYRSKKENIKALKCHFQALLMKPNKRALKSFLADLKTLFNT